jgi:hypothetical protein
MSTFTCNSLRTCRIYGFQNARPITHEKRSQHDYFLASFVANLKRVIAIHHRVHLSLPVGVRRGIGGGTGLSQGPSGRVVLGCLATASRKRRKGRANNPLASPVAAISVLPMRRLGSPRVHPALAV